MTDEKWRSPTGYSIASHETDKLPPKGERNNDVQAALDALDTILQVFGKGLVEANQLDGADALCELVGTIHRALAQQQPVNAVLDLDNAREVFENWLTGNGNYPHLKHKSFGGQYLSEEAAMKWDGFKAGYYARAEQKGGV